MIRLKYVLMIISIFLTMSILLVGCQTRAKQPPALKELNISVIATQMRVMEPAASPSLPPPSPTPIPPPTATPAKPGGPQAGPSPAPSPVAPPAKPGGPPAGSSPAPPPAAPPAKPGGPPAAPPPGPPPTISLTLTFKIDNPNEVDVKLQQINYSISGSGLSIPVKMGQLFIIDSKVPPKGSILREDTIEITRAGPYAAMWDLIKQVDKWSVNGVALIVQEGFAYPFAATK